MKLLFLEATAAILDTLDMDSWYWNDVQDWLYSRQLSDDELRDHETLAKEWKQRGAK